MNRVLIVEGCDGAGKTVLCNTLAKDHGFKVIHTDKPRPNEPDLFNTYLMDLWLALHEDQPVVFDRLYLGEVIYGPIMRGKSLLSDLHVRLLDRVVRAYDVKVILCAPAFDTVLRNWQIKKNDYVTEDIKLEAIYRAYRDQIKPRDMLLYDYSVVDDYETDQPGQHYHDAFIPNRTLPEGAIGSPTARVLLVGEQVNPRVQELDLPFMDGGGSSAYLDEALQLAGFKEEELAFCNAGNLKGYRNPLNDWLHRFQVIPRVVALGDIASKACCNEGVTHQKVPHPQFMKRFNHKKLQEYADMIKEAVCSSQV